MNPPAADAGSGPDVMAGVLQQAVSLARGLPGPLRRLSIRSGDVAVEIDWHETAVAAVVEAPVDEPVPDGEVVAAPLVGTFYRAPAPGAEPFVQVGSTIQAGQTLGIVEAMKLMNPIVGQVSGRVAEVLVQDGEPVQFDQHLFRLSRLSEDGEPGVLDVALAG
jgi:acetyl-CoA carboxylase biotin carboxyl carrier protein